MEKQIKTANKEVAQFLDRVIEAKNQTLIKAYETRIQELEDRKLVLEEKIVKCGTISQRFRVSTFTVGIGRSGFLLSKASLSS